MCHCLSSRASSHRRISTEDLTRCFGHSSSLSPRYRWHPRSQWPMLTISSRLSSLDTTISQTTTSRATVANSPTSRKQRSLALSYRLSLLACSLSSFALFSSEAFPGPGTMATSRQATTDQCFLLLEGRSLRRLPRSSLRWRLSIPPLGQIFPVRPRQLIRRPPRPG